MITCNEALELLLSYCIPKRDLNPLAHRLIDHFGSFAQVLDAAPEELEQVPGIGAYSATFLSLVAQAAGYYQRDKYSNRPMIMNAAEMGKYCTSLFVNDTDEKLYLISLNIHGQLLGSYAPARWTSWSFIRATWSTRRCVRARTRWCLLTIIRAARCAPAQPI